MKNEIEFNAYRCLQLFRDLLQAVDTKQNDITDQLSPLSLEDQLGKYQTWAGNLGALRRGHSSLDYRLRNTLFIAENIVRLLQSLQTSLTRGQSSRLGRKARDVLKYDTGVQLASGNLSEDVSNDEAFGFTTTSPVDSSSSSSDEGNISIPERTLIQECYIDIVEIIDKLLKLSIAIRSPSVRTATSKALCYVERDELGNDIFLLFEQFTTKKIRARYPKLSDQLVERLGKSISRRRRLFLYWRRHHQKLEIVEQDTEKQNLNPVSKTVLSQTTATEYVPGPETPSEASSVISGSAISGMSKESQVCIPPVHPANGEDFECPYCFCILHGKFQRKKLWEKHVYEDLQPYVCLFDHCPIEDQTFNNYEEWLDHQKWKHNSRWQCDDASHSKGFLTQESFEQHLITAHSEDARSAAFSQVVKRSRHPDSRLWMDCPFCGYMSKRSETSVHNLIQDKKISSRKLEKHVGEHLKRLATLALPWLDDVGDGTENELSDSQISRSSSSSVSRKQLKDWEDPIVGGVSELLDPSDYQEDKHSVPDKFDEWWDFLPQSNTQSTEDSTILDFITSFEKQQPAKQNIEMTQAPPYKYQSLDSEGEAPPISNSNPQHNLPSLEQRGSEIFYNEVDNQIENEPVMSAISYDSKSKGKSREVEDGLPALTTQVAASRHIRGTPGETEKLDKSYIIRRHDYLKFFKPGRVFSTLWNDPYSSSATESENDQFMSRINYDLYGERVITKIRRFLVVKQGGRSCTCLPVTTYDGKGHKKRGLKLSEHGLIYSEKHPGEIDGITKKALFVQLSRNGEVFRNPSYINYGRLYTVETNAKVREIGELDRESRTLLVTYYRDVHFPPEDDLNIPTESQAACLAGIRSNLGLAQSYSSATLGVVSDLAPPRSYSSSTAVPNEPDDDYILPTLEEAWAARTGVRSNLRVKSTLDPPQRYSSSTAVPSESTTTDHYQSSPQHQSSSIIIPNESDDDYALSALEEARAAGALVRSNLHAESNLDPPQRYSSSTAVPNQSGATNPYQSLRRRYSSNTAVPNQSGATNPYQSLRQRYFSNTAVPNEYTVTNRYHSPPNDERDFDAKQGPSAN